MLAIRENKISRIFPNLQYMQQTAFSDAYISCMMALKGLVNFGVKFNLSFHIKRKEKAKIRNR